MTFEPLVSSMSAAIGVQLSARPEARVHGGSINECYRWQSRSRPLFVKVAPADSEGMFAAEAAGLQELEAAQALRVPHVLGVGRTASHAWLALEWIDFGARTAAAQRALGERLADQHRRQAPAFGWDRNNTIGSTPQLNEWRDDWVSFFRERRLRYQLELADSTSRGAELRRRAAPLLERLGDFFANYRPVPALLHGDLWGGNWGADDSGTPVIFDPAIYYGDREADLAMTRLFGGFGADFYAAYAATWPLDPGAGVRTALYNLYHVLNHFNLFGAGYLAQASSMIDALLRELTG